jgi:PAS domain S-box-containing protein
MTRLRRLRDWPLRVQLAVVVASILVAALGALTALDVRAMRQRRLADEARLLQARADQLLESLEHVNRDYLAAAGRLARAPDVATFLERGDTAVDLTALVKQLSGLELDRPVRAVGAVDPAGVIRAATLPSLVGRRMTGPLAFDSAGARVVDPHVDGDGHPTVAYAAPARSSGGAVAGAVVLWVDAEVLWQVVRRLHGAAGKGSFAVILDRLGIRIAHSDDRDIVFHPAGRLPADVVDRLVADARFGARTRELLEGVRPAPEPFARARAERIDAGPFYSAARRNMQSDYGVGRRVATAPWTVFYMVPEATLTAPIARMTRDRIAFMSMVAILAIVVTFWFAGAIARPIQGLAGLSGRIAAGDLTARAGLDRGDEIGVLGQTFDDMSRQLEDDARNAERNRHKLEELVELRTAELADARRGLEREVDERFREANRALAESEQKYRDLYESSPDMHLTTDLRSQRIVECNQTLCDRLGYTRSELLGQPFYIVYFDDEIADLADRTTAFVQLGEFSDVERRLRCKDGSAIEASLHLRAVRDDTGTPIAARAIWRDITARKQGERDRQFMLQVGETLGSSPSVEDVLGAVSAEVGRYLGTPRCAFVEIDADADRAIAHRDFHGGLPSITGEYQASAFGPDAIAELARGNVLVLDDTERDPRTAASIEAYRQVELRSLVSVPLRRDGRWSACLMAGDRRPRPWAEREIALLKLIAERVWAWIEHLRLLDALRHQAVAVAVQRVEERFRDIVDSVQDYGIFMLDPDGCFATWNRGAQRIYGYEPSDLLGKHFSTFWTEDERERGRPQAELDNARRAGRCVHEAWRVRKDGSRFWVNATITAMYAPDGSFEGFSGVTRDVTMLREHEEELRAKQLALAQSLKEREVLLQEIHHRVKNNLQVISSLINMQARRLERGAARDALEECQTRVLAIALIHEKLYESKDYSEVRFAEYARSLAGTVFHATGVSPDGITLLLSIDDLALKIDRAIPCGLIINELITNALKHAFRDRRNGTIWVGLTSADPGRLRLTVRDDGFGLPAGFEVDSVNSMGLQLVTTLCEQLAGTLEVTCNPGACFQLTFSEKG